MAKKKAKQNKEFGVGSIIALVIAGLVLIGIGTKILVQHILEGTIRDDLIVADAAAFVLAAALVLFAITTERRAECKCSVKPLFLLYLISGGVLFLIGTALLILSFIIL